MCIVESANPHDHNQTLIAVTFYLGADDILAPQLGVLFFYNNVELNTETLVTKALAFKTQKVATHWMHHII